MRRMLTIAGVAAWLLVGGALVAAAGTVSRDLKGEVLRVDSAAQTLTVKETAKKGTPQELTFRIGSDTKITAGAKSEKFADLKSGDHVTVNYTDEAGMKLARRIDVAARDPKPVRYPPR